MSQERKFEATPRLATFGVHKMKNLRKRSRTADNLRGDAKKGKRRTE